ncbi:MAG TPA: SemiSWEET family transporter [Candidatus Omnitrophota bacterium]|nr:SemiSWEET family transporter [Candidatus Omnitrophota bacterium]HRZ15309.1 SemiSWEET family transporter [Candidatus Omnitrophota bacterium]
MIWQIVGFGAAFLTMFGFLPQVIKIYKTKSVGDISILALFQFVIGILLWLLYGLHLRNAVIILANSVTLAILIVGVTLYFRYRKKK